MKDRFRILFFLNETESNTCCNPIFREGTLSNGLPILFPLSAFLYTKNHCSKTTLARDQWG